MLQNILLIHSAAETLIFWAGINSLHLLTYSFAQLLTYSFGCQLFHWCTALTTHLFRLLSAGLWSVLFNSSLLRCKTKPLMPPENSFTSMKLALVFKEMILIYVLPFWPRSIMICLDVEFFTDPSVRAGSGTKLNGGTGWHNVMQTSYQLISTSCGSVGPYSPRGIICCPLFACDTVMVHMFQDLDVQG